MPDPPVTAAQTDQQRALELVDVLSAQPQVATSLPEGPSVALVLAAFAAVRAEQAATDTAWHEREIERLHATIADKMTDAHGCAQESTIADVNAGLIDDLIAPRLAPLQAEISRLRADIESAEEEARTRALWTDSYARGGDANLAEAKARGESLEQARDALRQALREAQQGFATLATMANTGDGGARGLNIGGIAQRERLNVDRALEADHG